LWREANYETSSCKVGRLDEYSGFRKEEHATLVTATFRSTVAEAQDESEVFRNQQEKEENQDRIFILQDSLSIHLKEWRFLLQKGQAAAHFTELKKADEPEEMEMQRILDAARYRRTVHEMGDTAPRCNS
jgi:hypothetical protein